MPKPNWASESPTLEEEKRFCYQDFLVEPCDTDYSYTPTPQKYGKMYLFYGDSSVGKSFVGGTWYDHECLKCGAKIVSPQKGKITACPLCRGKKIQKRPIVSVDFELGRGKELKDNQFMNKEYLICEPRILADDYNPLSDDDSTDVVASQDRFIDFLLAVFLDTKKGLIHPSCIIVDSATDLWSIVQEWGVQELIKYHEKYTKKNAKLMRTIIQTDWKVMNNRHFKIIQICRAMLKLGIDIIWTARYEGPPDYVKDGTQKIRAQKDVSFYSDIRIHMEHRTQGTQKLYTSHVEKLGAFESPVEPIDRINYVKIQQIYKEAKEKHLATLSEDVEAIVV